MEHAVQLFNPPEAIRNLVTPVATPRSVRPGFFHPSGHTTVCQTRFFFFNTFCTRTSKAIPRSHRPGPWYCHWCPMSKKWQKKNPVCETVVWPLTLKKTRCVRPFDEVTGGLCQKPGRRRPSSIKTSPYWWTTDSDLKIVAFQIAANTMARNGRGRI